MTTAIVGRNGRVTIPKDVRDALGIRPGEKFQAHAIGADAFTSKG